VPFLVVAVLLAAVHVPVLALAILLTPPSWNRCDCGTPAMVLEGGAHRGALILL
jgi:hypothetical protein